MGKVKISSILMWITFIPLLLPEGIYSLIGVPMKLRLIIWGLDFILLLCLLFKKKFDVSLPFKIIMLIDATIIYSAYIHGHGELVSVLSNNFCGMVMCAAFEYWMRNYFDTAIKYLYHTLFILIVINFIFLLAFPGGLYASTLELSNVTIASHLTYDLNWLFGYKNNQFGFTLPFLALTCVYGYFKKEKLRRSEIYAFLLCIVSELMAQATMATVLLTIYTFAVFVIVNRKSKWNHIIKKLYNIKTIVLVTIIVFLSIVVFNSNNYVANIITRISVFLGKDSKFNGRSEIWAVAINFIKQSPIIGYGNIDSEVFIEQSRVLGGTHAHNYILHLMILGGAVCLIEHVFLYFITIRKIVINKNPISEIMGMMLGLFFINGITSINFYYPLFNSMFVLAFYSIEYYKKSTEEPNVFDNNLYLQRREKIRQSA